MTKPFACQAFILCVCSAVATVSPASAATLISDFNNFALSGMYESWANSAVTTIESELDSYNVTSRGFGGGFFDINPQIDATGETLIALEVTVDAANSLPGVVLALVDGDGTLHNYAWYALADRTHVLTKTIGDTTFAGQSGLVPGLDLATLDFFHIQVDGQSPYRVSYRNVELTIPEPASLLMTICGCSVILLRRPRMRS